LGIEAGTDVDMDELAAAAAAVDEVPGDGEKTAKKLPNRWTAEETEALKAGVAKYKGEAKMLWRKILNDEEFAVPLENKSGFNVLKDKYRLLLKYDTANFSRRGFLVVPTGWEKMLRNLPPSDEVAVAAGAAGAAGAAEAAPQNMFQVPPEREESDSEESSEDSD